MGCFRFGCIYRIHAPKVSALHGHGACSCTVVYLGGSYASGALSAFVRVSRHKTLCVYHLSHCFLLVFVFCLINIFFKFKFKFKYYCIICDNSIVTSPAVGLMLWIFKVAWNFVFLHKTVPGGRRQITSFYRLALVCSILTWINAKTRMSAPRCTKQKS